MILWTVPAILILLQNVYAVLGFPQLTMLAVAPEVLSDVSDSFLECSMLCDNFFLMRYGRPFSVYPVNDNENMIMLPNVITCSDNKFYNKELYYETILKPLLLHLCQKSPMLIRHIKVIAQRRTHTEEQPGDSSFSEVPKKRNKLFIGRISGIADKQNLNSLRLKKVKGNIFVTNKTTNKKKYGLPHKKESKIVSESERSTRLKDVNKLFLRKTVHHVPADIFGTDKTFTNKENTNTSTAYVQNQQTNEEKRPAAFNSEKILNTTNTIQNLNKSIADTSINEMRIYTERRIIKTISNSFNMSAGNDEIYNNDQMLDSYKMSANSTSSLTAKVNNSSIYTNKKNDGLPFIKESKIVSETERSTRLKDIFKLFPRKSVHHVPTEIFAPGKTFTNKENTNTSTAYVQNLQTNEEKRPAAFNFEKILNTSNTKPNFNKNIAYTPRNETRRYKERRIIDTMSNSLNMPEETDVIFNNDKMLDSDKKSTNSKSSSTAKVDNSFIYTVNNIETSTDIVKSDNSHALQRTKEKNMLIKQFSLAFDKFDQYFYKTTNNKLMSISPEERQENGISFVQSGLFLSLLLMTLSTETSEQATAEINNVLGLNVTNAEKCIIINDTLSTLPKSNNDLIIRWSTRLILGASQNVSQEFRDNAATALQMHVGTLNGSESSKSLADQLNSLMEKDSKGAIRNTFEPEELSGGVNSIALSMVYIRARWRSAPTVLNDTHAFHDANATSSRTTRMIRINDVMRYANFEDWGFQAMEISYATPGLRLLLLVPHGTSIRKTAKLMETTSVNDVTEKMVTRRLAVIMPLYTLRMTLLLPSKLQAMGIHSLIVEANATNSGELKLSHAVQRLMFWSEAGRNAFKDDGIEWDETPEKELVVDRPYLFYIRWHSITLMNGNFAL